MKYYGVRGIALKWFENYLKSRVQYVCIDSECSANLPIECGVPQGSIFGHLLFLIYVNDLAQVTSKSISILFADDTNVIFRSKSYESLNTIINSELALLSDWFNENKLALNVPKTKFMLFHHRHKKPSDVFSVSLNNIELEEVSNTKFLGVIINEHLAWENHIHGLTGKLSRLNGVLARLKHQLPLHVMKTIYNALFASILQYGISVWGGTITKQSKSLVTLQKKAIRHASCSKYNSHTEPVFERLGFLEFDDSFKIQCVKILYKEKD